MSGVFYLINIFFLCIFVSVTEEIKDKIKKAHYLKLLGNIPEGFVMVHEKVIEDLKDFDNWKDFKYNSNYIEEKNIEKVLSKDFEDGKI